MSVEVQVFHIRGVIIPETSLVVQRLGLCTSTAMDTGLIAGQATKTPQTGILFFFSCNSFLKLFSPDLYNSGKNLLALAMAQLTKIGEMFLKTVT